MLNASFSTDKVLLSELLRQVDSGAIQLPDFQRSWVWDDAHIRSLLASISVSFPIGAILTLATGGEANFLTRPIEGANPQHDNPDILLLDGQQRMTTLYQSLFTDTPVHTRNTQGKVIDRHYYIDVGRFLDQAGERDDWIVSIPAERLVKQLQTTTLDLRTQELEFEHALFPLNKVFRSTEWIAGFVAFCAARSGPQLALDFAGTLNQSFSTYSLPVIALSKDTSKEAVCLVFEKVNTGGVTLNVFELVTASFAAESFQLREDWHAREERLERDYPVLGDLEPDQFLQVVTLLATYDRRSRALASDADPERLPPVACRRREILRLSLDEYKRWREVAEDGFVRAAKFLGDQYVFASWDVPYRTQLVPLAAILALLDRSGESFNKQQQLARWYWCGVMGEMYGSAVETTFARDLVEVLEWLLHDGPEPSTIRDAAFQANRLGTLRTRNSAAYKGVHGLLMRSGSRDFRTGKGLQKQVFDQESIDIHHIFPRAWCERQDPNIQRKWYDSIVNKSAISSYTNQRVGGGAPSKYLADLAKEIEPSELDDVLRSHLIPVDELHRNDFWGFFEERAENLLQLIESAMGKVIARDPAAFKPDAVIEEYVDEAEPR